MKTDVGVGVGCAVVCVCVCVPLRGRTSSNEDTFVKLKARDANTQGRHVSQLLLFPS